MKSVLDWVKSNILADIAILIVLVSVAVIVFMHFQGASLRERMSERQQAINELRGFMSQRVAVPSEDPNQPPREIGGLTIREATIEAVDRIQERMSSEARQTSQYLRQKNQAGHELLLEGMLPQTRAAFNARENYINAFPQLLAPYDPGARYVGLNAGLPLAAGQIQDELDKVREQYTQYAAGGDEREQPAGRGRGRSGGGSGDDAGLQGLTKETRQRLREALRKRLAGMLEGHAEQIDIYADPRLRTDDGRKNPDFPFQIANWAIGDDGRSPGTLPTSAQLYEGQIEFWVQQDIARAIAIANRVEDDNPQFNVLNAPVKRLIQLDVLPGYIGLHDGQQHRRDYNVTNTRGRGTASAESTLYPIPPAGHIGDPDKPLPDNFMVSPTGRVSNALYDVRHARLRIVADATQLPAFFDALARINLMTVIDMQITDVDEWQALKEGYLYRGDVVELDLRIESLWLRSWTRELMPEETRLYLGVTRPDNIASADRS